MKTVEHSYEEIVDFFARGATSAKILAFRPSPKSQERVRHLLARNSAGEITAEETAELERFGQLEHLMQLVKARAHRYLDSDTSSQAR